MAAGGRRTRTGLSLIIAVIAMTGAATASPWARPPGELLIINTSDYFHADLTREDPRGAVFDRIDANVYVEFGLARHVTVGGKAVYSTAWLTRQSRADSSAAFSEIELFAQYEILRDARQAASVRIAAARAAPFGASAANALKTEDGDLELAALYGRDFPQFPVKIFAAAEAGFRRRFGAPADQLRFQATFGVEPHRRIVILAEGLGTLSVRNEADDGADYDRIRLQGSVIWRFTPRFALQLGAGKDIATRRLAPGESYFIGVWTAF